MLVTGQSDSASSTIADEKLFWVRMFDGNQTLFNTINPLSPDSDQHQTSPHDISAL